MIIAALGISALKNIQPYWEKKCLIFYFLMNIKNKNITHQGKSSAVPDQMKLKNLVRLSLTK